MEGNLFPSPAKYTIDSSSLMDIFGAEKMVSKTITPGLWENVVELMTAGVIVSHIEVLNEIKKEGVRGEELYDWAHMNASIFHDYDWKKEGAVIRLMSPKYSAFVNAKLGKVHADPWLVAQAKCRNLKVITEEKFSNSPDVKRHKLPNVCRDPIFAVGCIDLIGLIREQNWSFRR